LSKDGCDHQFITAYGLKANTRAWELKIPDLCEWKSHYADQFMKKEKWQIMYDKYGEDLMPQSVIDGFAEIRAKVMNAVSQSRANGEPISIEEARKQIELFNKAYEKEYKKNRSSR
jgi:hypothetical protein